MFDKSAWLVRAGETIAAAIARPDTEHAIFHGCYDWHSAVHGHWALLRIARVTGEQRFAEAALAELAGDRLAAETALLANQPHFEMPYGRAWLLRLAIEHATVTGSPLLHALADEVAGSITRFFETTPPLPTSREYDNASWALAQLAAYGKARGDDALVATVQRHVETSFLDAGNVPDLSTDQKRCEFFSPRANWLYLIATTQPAATLAKVLRDAALDDRALVPISAVGYIAHSFGANWCRAWAWHRLSLVAPHPRDREMFRRAYERHVEVALIEHANDRGVQDYAFYSHWVPQFAVYALTEDV